MHELVVTNIDADVGERPAHRIEEHEIARLQLASREPSRRHGSSSSARRGERHAERVLEHVTHEATAIQAGIRRVAAPAIAHADHVERADDHVAFACSAGEEGIRVPLLDVADGVVDEVLVTLPEPATG